MDALRDPLDRIHVAMLRAGAWRHCALCQRGDADFAVAFIPAEIHRGAFEGDAARGFAKYVCAGCLAAALACIDAGGVAPERLMIAGPPVTYSGRGFVIRTGRP